MEMYLQLLQHSRLHIVLPLLLFVCWFDGRQCGRYQVEQVKILLSLSFALVSCEGTGAFSFMPSLTAGRNILK